MILGLSASRAWRVVAPMTSDSIHDTASGGAGWWAGEVTCRTCRYVHIAVLPYAVADCVSECPCCGSLACYPVEPDDADRK